MKPAIPAAGPILRRAGLLIELACLLTLVTQGESRQEIAGISVRHLLMIGVALGFLLWAVGLALLLRAYRQSRPTK
jgi:NADH:ubiquinone oxidoreductase subunit K